jgi:hypothetical protein
LLQKNVLPLMSALCDADRIVFIETSGAHDISRIDLACTALWISRHLQAGKSLGISTRISLFSNIVMR